MKLSEVRINLIPDTRSRLRAFCSLTFDQAFVVRDVKLIQGAEGLFLAMPSRKLSDHCCHYGEKNHLRARFCNQCGASLNADRHSHPSASGPSRSKLHADIAHPISAGCREEIEREVFAAYEHELERSRHPGYTPPDLDRYTLDEKPFANEVFSA